MRVLATGRNRTFLQASAPTAAESTEGDLWYDRSNSNALYRRGAGSGVLAIGGSALMVGGNHILVAPWQPASDLRIDAARAEAAAAQARLAAILSDSILSVDEKRQFARDWQAAQASYAALDGKAASFGNVASLRSALTSAYNALSAAIAAITPAYNDYTVDSPVDRQTVETRWANFYTAYAALDVAITAQTLVVQWSVNATGPWHADYAAGDKYQRQSVDGGLTFSAPAKVVGEDGKDGRAGLDGKDGTPGAKGADGRTQYLHTAYANAADGSIDFTTGEPGARRYIGVLIDFVAADSEDRTLYSWSLIKGADGLNGKDGTPGANGVDGKPTYVHVAYANAADGSVDFSVDDPAGRGYVGFYTDQVVADSTNPALYSWSLVKGANGQRTSFVFQRAAAQPATPTAATTPPPGWSDAPPVQTAPPLPLWQASADFRDGVRLTAWSTPIKLTAASLADLDPTAAAILAGKGRVFRQGSAPLASASQENDLWFETSNGDAAYSRGVGTGVLEVGGNRITVGGSGIVVAPWLPVSNPLAVKAAADAALAIAQANAAASDGVLTPAEKALYSQYRAEAVGECDGLIAKATAQGLSSTTYANAYAAYVGYLDTLNLVDRSSNTGIDATTLNDRITAYATTKTALISATGDLTAANQVSTSVATSFGVDADYQGNVTGGLPLTIVPKVTRGGSDVRTADAATYAIIATSCTASVDTAAGSSTKGFVTVSAVAANTATVDLTVTIGGVAQPASRLTITKRLASPPASGSSASKSAQDGTLNTISATSFVALSDVLTLSLATGEQLYGTASVDYNIVRGNTASANRTVSAKWQWRTAGSSAWSDFGAAITGSTAQSGSEPVSGHGDFNQVKSGLSAATYEIQLVGMLNAASRSVEFTGAAFVEAKP